MNKTHEDNNKIAEGLFAIAYAIREHTRTLEDMAAISGSIDGLSRTIFDVFGSAEVGDALKEITGISSGIYAIVSAVDGLNKEDKTYE